jgi:hypothetical protein
MAACFAAAVLVLGLVGDALSQNLTVPVPFSSYAGSLSPESGAPSPGAEGYEAYGAYEAYEAPELKRADLAVAGQGASFPEAASQADGWAAGEMSPGSQSPQAPPLPEIFDLQVLSPDIAALDTAAPDPVASSTLVISALEADPEAEQFSKAYSITLELAAEDFPAALAVIHSLPGDTLQASAEYGGGQYSGAWVDRTVDPLAYEASKETLAALGKVRSDSETGRRLTDAISDAGTRARAKDQEVARLLKLLEESASVTVMAAVEEQLAQVERERDEIKTNLLAATASAASPTLSVVLISRAPSLPVSALTFGEKLRGAFMGSINFCLGLGQEALVFLAGAAVPLALAGGVAVLALWLYRRRKKRSRGLFVLLLALALGAGGCAPKSARPAAPQATAYPEAAWNTSAESKAAAMEESAVGPAYDTYDMPMPDPQPPPDTAPQARKKILTGQLSLETSEFDRVVAEARQIVRRLEGYVEDSAQTFSGDQRHRNFNATVKIPADRYEEGRDALRGLGVLTAFSEQTEDATARYYDMASRLETDKISEARVLALIEEATRIQDILTLERRLAQIRERIALYEAEMQNIDRLTAYATLSLYVREVALETVAPPAGDFGARLAASFTGSLQNLGRFFEGVAVALAALAVPAALLGGLALAARLVYKKSRRRKPASLESDLR